MIRAATFAHEVIGAGGKSRSKDCTGQGPSTTRISTSVDARFRQERFVSVGESVAFPAPYKMVGQIQDVE